MIDIFYKMLFNLLNNALKYFTTKLSFFHWSKRSMMIVDEESIIDEYMIRFDHAVTRDSILKWLDNFEATDRSNALRLLANLEYISQADLFYYANELVETVLEKIGDNIKIYFIPIAKYGKSATLLAYYLQKSSAFKKAEDSSYAVFLPTPYDITSARFESNSCVVFFDDFFGSGGSFIETYIPFCGLAPGGFGHLRTFAASLFYMPKAADTIKEAFPHVEVSGATHRPIFGIPTQYWNDQFENDALRDMSLFYATKAKLWTKKHYLGYKGSQALISFCYMPPNNTLPIIWSTRSAWFPLMPRDQESKLSAREANKLVIAYSAARGWLNIPTDHQLTSSKKKDSYILVSILDMIERGFAHASIQSRLAIRGRLYDSFIDIAYNTGLIDDEHRLTHIGKAEVEKLKVETKSYRKRSSKNVSFVQGPYAPKRIS